MEFPSADAQILRSMQALEQHAEIRSYEPGDVIFSVGEQGDCMFGVLKGAVRLAWADGGVTEALGPGRVFGEGALVQASHTRHGTATAVESARLLVLNRETFLFALQTLPLFAVELLASLEGRMEDLRRQMGR